MKKIIISTITILLLLIVLNFTYGSISIEIKNYEALDLGIFPPANSLFISIPKNISLSVLYANVSKVLRAPNPSGKDTLAIGLWVADSSGKILALLISKVSEVEYIRTREINIEPWKNIPIIECGTTRPYPLIKYQIDNGGYAFVIFTLSDFDLALKFLGKTAEDLTVIGLFTYHDLTHIYTYNHTILSIKTSGLYSIANMRIISAIINNTFYIAEGGVIRLNEPIHGNITINLQGSIFFIPIYHKIMVNL
jgi:hypothetical protein